MRGAVAAPQPRAAEVGAEVLADGGNAFDAAVATAFAQMVTDPWMCGVAGHGTAMIRTADGRAVTLEFSATAGSGVREDMWAGQMKGRAKVGAAVLFEDFRNELGYTSICTPGTLAGLWAVHEEFCALPWARLLEPAIAIARRGERVPPHVHRYWTEERQEGDPDGQRRLSATPAAAVLYLKPGGGIIDEGHLLVLEDYANTLQAIADEGADVFYRGRIAEQIAADMKANGGFVTLEDLHNYKIRRFKPLTFSYRGHEVIAAPPPVGGVVLCEILNILSGYDLSSMAHSGADHLHLLASALKFAHADRRRFLGDPDYVDVPIDYMLNPETGVRYRSLIDGGRLPVGDDWDIDHHTTHVSTYDEAGNCAAITHSLGSGSGVITPGLGFVYNNSMKHFNPEPGTPNSIRPGKARIRGSSPTVVLHNGSPRIVVGAPGGSVIISSVVQAIINIIDFQMSATEAVSAPRIHCEGGAVFVEARVVKPVVNELERRGHSVDFLVESFGRLLSAAHAIHVPPDGGRIQSGADPRRGGGVAFYDGRAVGTWGWVPEAVPAAT
jgi:gamma-glutamyltranspeptidase/glutathione hydrolase